MNYAPCAMFKVQGTLLLDHQSNPVLFMWEVKLLGKVLPSASSFLIRFMRHTGETRHCFQTFENSCDERVEMK